VDDTLRWHIIYIQHFMKKDGLNHCDNLNSPCSCILPESYVDPDSISKSGEARVWMTL
jgi:hypothetical protein